MKFVESLESKSPRREAATSDSPDSKDPTDSKDFRD